MKLVPGHAKYESIVQNLTFVALALSISTFCTITDDVVAKVEGLPATGKAKVKVCQENFQSVIFWTNGLAKIS